MVRLLKIVLPVAALAVIGWLVFLRPGAKAAPLDIPQGNWESVAAALPAQLAAAKEEGLPLTAEDITPKPVPSEQNAATYYKQATALFAKLPAEQRASMQKAFERAVRGGAKRTPTFASYERIKQLLIEGSRQKACDFQRDWTQGFNVLFPEYAHLKNLVKAMAAEAVVLARRGKTDEAVSLLRASARVSRHCSSDPILIALLVRLASEALTLRAAEIIASEQAERPEVLAKLQGVMRELKPEANLMEALKGEIVMGRYSIQMINSLAELESMSAGKPLGSSPTPGIPPALKKAWEARFLSYWRRVYAKYRNGEAKTPLQVGSMLDQLEKEESRHTGDVTYILNVILLPVFEQAGQAVAASHARVRLVETKLALLLHRSQQGSFPSDLGHLGKNIDPFTDDSLVYSPTATTFVLYSVGRDGQDNGGKHGSARMGTDITVEHPLNPAKLPNPQ